MHGQHEQPQMTMRRGWPSHSDFPWAHIPLLWRINGSTAKTIEVLSQVDIEVRFIQHYIEK